MKERPILFSTEMVRAIIKGPKTQTRRVIKPQPEVYKVLEDHKTVVDIGDPKPGKIMYRWEKSNISVQTDNLSDYLMGILGYSPYGKPGDELWVRETFASLCKNADPYCWCDEDEKKEHHFYQYKADTHRKFRGEGKYDRYPGNWDDALTESGQTHHPKEADHIPRWKPSIHMPRRASRIQLTVTDIRVERVQEITISDIKAEGVEIVDRWDSQDVIIAKWIELWDSINAKPKPVKADGVIHHYVSYPWEDIQETREHRGKPWYVIGNPWVWVVGFEIKMIKGGSDE